VEKSGPYKYELIVVNNDTAKNVPVTGKIEVISAK
jgi:hypothetical protein